MALIETLGIKKEEIGESLSTYYNCFFKEFDPQLPVPVELLTKLKKTYLLRNSWVPLSWEMTEGRVDVLIDDPNDLNKTDNIAALINAKKIVYSVGIKEDIHQFIKLFFETSTTPDSETDDTESDEFDLMSDVDFEEIDDDEDYEVEEISEASGQIVRMVDQILITAYRKGASDIHIEPTPQTRKCHIRFRIDGVCQDFLKVPIASARAILSRLKIMSKLDIAERRLPQDGKIKFKRKGIKPFELRIATLPTSGNFEDAVLRLLAESGAMKLDEMEINKGKLAIIERIIQQPYGLFLAVGPTGSGKTTTLHAAMGYVNKPGIKIWTAEDPVEISQLGLRQVEVKPKIGLDFSRVMRAFLRADPDVIMIGEMRDKETASTGIEASLTGHLVFSTLHTNSAPETITRLLDMGLNPLNFSDAFLGVLAQRLVRRLCQKCKEEYKPTQEQLEDIKSLYGADQFQNAEIESPEDAVLFRPSGCGLCNGTGYKGRLAIHELLEGSKIIKSMIKHSANTEELFKQAREEGMFTLVQDGIHKAYQGITDIDEIRRVCVS